MTGKARGTGPTRAVRLLVTQRARGLCERCGSFRVSDIHHRRPRRMGGSRDPETNTPANLVLLCRTCHADIESHRQQALLDGWLLHSTQEPSQHPVRMHGFGLVNLTKEGTYLMHPAGH